MKPRDLIERIERIDPQTAGAGEITAALGALHRLTGWASVRQAELARRLGELETSADGPPVDDVLARAAHSSQRDAARARKRADTYGRVPALEQQRTKGRVSDEHADAFARTADRLDDTRRDELYARGDELARHAAATTPAQFARHLARLADTLTADDGLERSEHQRAAATLSHGINNESGMGWIRADLHPDDHQRIKARLDAEIAALRTRPDHQDHRYDQLAAAALVNLVTSNRTAATPPPEVTIIVDLDTITTGRHPDTICEYEDGTPLPVETVRRHACTAHLIPVVLGGDSQPLDVGRARRHATSAQRRALRSMYRTCAVGGCERSFDRCEIHHLLEWDRHSGPTDLANLLPLCSYHHHRAHEGRWRLQLDPSTRQLDIELPNGQHHSTALPDMITDARIKTPAA